MSNIQLPSDPGYIFAHCQKEISGNIVRYSDEVWSVRDMSQVCQADIGQCGIVSKVGLQFNTPPPGIFESITVTGVSGLGNPFVFGTWHVQFGMPLSNSDPWYMNGNIQDASDNLQWDAYQLNNPFKFPKIGSADWTCYTLHFAFDTPRSIN